MNRHISGLSPREVLATFRPMVSPEVSLTSVEATIQET